MLTHPRLLNVLYLAILFSVVSVGCSKQLSQPRVPEPEPEANLSPAVMDGPNPEALFLQNASKDPRVNNRIWEGIPSVGATNDGKEIYVAWYSGGQGEGPGNYITVALSRNNAKTWLRDALVIYPSDTAHVRMYDPGLWRDRQGVVRVTWTKSHQFWDGTGGVWTTPLSWNGKNVVTGEVSQLADGVMLNKPAYIPSRQMVLFPISWWAFAPADPGKAGTYIYSGAYNGSAEKMGPVSVLSKIIVPDSIRTFDEHQLVETGNDGNLLCLLRTSKGIYFSRSADYGAHWSKIAPFTFVGDAAASRFHISKLKSGKLLLVINNSMVRTNLVAYLSSDGGKTWKYKLLLDQRSNVSYPDAIQTADGNIHVVYDRDRFTTKDILYCRFTENDIIHANTAGIVRSKVNL